MKIIPKEKYYKVIPLVEKVSCNILFAEVVVFHKASGTIFVDNDDCPTICLIVHKYGMSLLTGIPNYLFSNDLCTFLVSNQNIVKWVLVYPDSLSVILYQNISDRIYDYNMFDISKKGILLCRTKRVMFDFIGVTDIKNTNNFQIHKIAGTDFMRINGSVAPKNFWDTSEDFIENGVGFFIELSNTIACYCFSAFANVKKIEIGIETNLSYRRKGLAHFVATYMLKYCIENNLQPLWSCRIENVKSMKLAQKLGFIPKSEHEYFVIEKCT